MYMQLNLLYIMYNGNISMTQCHNLFVEMVTPPNLLRCFMMQYISYASKLVLLTSRKESTNWDCSPSISRDEIMHNRMRF
jgi:hypothetical protein